jgi:hypothetical protein
MKFLSLLFFVAALAKPNLHAAEETVYASVIEKILNTSCTNCHRADKKKGKLDMSTYEALMKGGGSQGKGKPTVKAGHAEQSLMIKLIELPEDDEDHMPPGDSKAPQLSAKDLALLTWWINEGASKDAKLAEAKLPEDLKTTAAELSKKQVAPPTTGKEKPSAKEAPTSLHKEEDEDEDEDD